MNPWIALTLLVQNIIKQPHHMIILVGAPGSGKSYFAKALERASPSTYVRVNQDELKTRKKCERICREAIQGDKIPIIDRCNFDIDQRSHFLTIAKEELWVKSVVECIIFDYPKETLIQRCKNRVGHETVTSENAERVVKMMLGRIRHPEMSMTVDWDMKNSGMCGIGSSNTKCDSERGEYFRDITIVQSEEESNEVLANILNKRPISTRSKSRSKPKYTTSESQLLPKSPFRKQKIAGRTSTTRSCTGTTSSSSPSSSTIQATAKATPGPDGFFKIYCDLDGVLADFDGGVAEIFNGRHPDNIGSIQLWSGINRADKFYENLSMTSDGQELWDALIESFASSSSSLSGDGSSNHKQPLPDILTGVPRTKRFREEKFNWCIQKLGTRLRNNDIECNHVDMAGPKKSHGLVKGVKRDDCINIITCWSDNKHIESRPGAVLIDDREKFLQAWEKNGGTFIHHTSTVNTLQKLRDKGIIPRDD